MIFYAICMRYATTCAEQNPSVGRRGDLRAAARPPLHGRRAPRLRGAREEEPVRRGHAAQRVRAAARALRRRGRCLDTEADHNSTKCQQSFANTGCRGFGVSQCHP